MPLGPKSPDVGVSRVLQGIYTGNIVKVFLSGQLGIEPWNMVIVNSVDPDEVPPLETNKVLFLLVWYNKLGMVHGLGHGL